MTSDGRPPIKIRTTGLYKSPQKANKPSKNESTNDMKSEHSHENIVQNTSSSGVKNKSTAQKQRDTINSEASPNKDKKPVEQENPTLKENQHQPVQPNNHHVESNENPKLEKKSIEETSPKMPTKQISSTSDEFMRPLDIFEDELATNLEKYLLSVDDGMKQSFISDPADLLRRANNGQDPLWFELVETGQRIGLAVTHVDNTYFAARRLIILHFSVLNRTHYQEYLQKFVDYLWKNEECDEIKISLYHIEDENHNMGADKELQDSIKKLGFRWKQLTNDKLTGKRYIDFLMKRPENCPCEIQKMYTKPELC